MESQGVPSHCVGIRIPEPLDGARALYKRRGDLSLQKGSLILRRTARNLVEIQLTL